MTIAKPAPSDDFMGNDLLDAADAINAAVTAPNWEELGNLWIEAKAAAAARTLTASAVDGMIERAKPLIPPSDPLTLEELERDLRALLPA